MTHLGVRHCQRSVGEGVGRVLIDCLLQQCQTAFISLRRHLVQEELSFEVGLVGLRIDGPSARQNGLRLRGEYGVDFVGTQIDGDALSGFDADHEGHAGWSATELAAGSASKDPNYPASGIYDWLNQHATDYLLLHVGTDVLTTSTDGVAAILDAIDRWEHDTGARITVIVARIIDQNPPDENAQVSTFNANLQALVDARIANGDNLVIVDQQSALWDANDLPDPAYYGDSLHPNDQGYALMAERWFEALSGVLQTCPTASDDTVTGVPRLR